MSDRGPMSLDEVTRAAQARILAASHDPEHPDGGALDADPPG